MRTLSLQISVENPTIQTDQEKQITNEDNRSSMETQYELHRLFKDNLKKDDFQGEFFNKMYDLERRRFSMQIVPYMPIHPTQLNNTSVVMKSEEQKDEKETLKPIETIEIKTKKNDDHLFKKPFLPLPYTVEEPCDTTNRRPLRMKRSYSQSVRYNNNLTVVELQNDSPLRFSQSDCFILEPSTPVLDESSTNHIHASFLVNKPSVQITEYFDFPLTNSFDDSVDVHSSLSFDACDPMDDEF
ncbi:hypothetical protein I4U23_018397 [Adineta vaga]|nr:hypothetical protein I4U23_018397 [Adineta vaga]